MNLTGIFREVLILAAMGTLLTLLLFGLKIMFKGRLSARWQYMVWFLLIVRLMLPYAPQNQFSVYNLIKPLMSDVQQAGAPSTINDLTEETDTQDNGTQEKGAIIPYTYTYQPSVTPNVKETWEVMDILAVVWLIGAGVLAFVTLIANIRFYGRMRYSLPCKDPNSLKILKDCYRLASVNRPVPLFLSEEARVPLLMGIAKPRLIISGQVLNRLSPEEQRHIFLHELMHYKRKDILVNWMAALIRCIYWFNPLVHFAFEKMREDCELSCDESVLKLLEPAEYRHYGQTILNLIGMFSNAYALACTSALATKKSSVKRRIYMISKYKQRTIIGTLMALGLTLLVGCSTLTNAESDIMGSFIDPAPTPAPTLNIEAEPDESLLEKQVLNYQSSEDALKDQAERSEELNNQVKEKEESLKKDIEQIQALVDEKALEEKVQTYLEKLKDKSFTGIYGDGYTWYTAAEELGMIGKPAIPGLIKKLDTEDDYERALVLYALLLATQHENVQSFTHGEYINVNLDFDAKNHPAMVETARAWWEKYKGNF